MALANRTYGCLAYLFIFAAGLIWTAPVRAADTEAALWAALQSGGHFALVRHTTAPGTGDPPSFSLRDCSTQRNLSDHGRDQAMRIGLKFRANGITTARIFSSQWCRCLETARLLNLGQIQELPVLNSFFSSRDRTQSQTQALKKWLAGQRMSQVLILVTHQVNITALIGVFPAPGEVIVVRREKNGDLTTVGTMMTD